MGNPEQKPVDATSKPEESGSESSIDYEKRFKDTQGAYTKSQQELKEAQAKLEALEKLTVPQIELDEATKAELESLKYKDPEAWRSRLNTLEIEAQNKHKETLNEAVRIANQETELEQRTRILAEFQASHPDVVINDEVIKLDVPSRITSKLERGEISFEQLLTEVKDYLKAPKVIGDGNTVHQQPNLSNLGGDDTPTSDANKKDIVKDYAEVVF